LGLHRKRSATPVRKGECATSLTTNTADIVDEYFCPFVALWRVHIQGLAPSPPSAIGAAISVRGGLALKQLALERLNPIGLSHSREIPAAGAGSPASS
jgi:hypothetical protein